MNVTNERYLNAIKLFLTAVTPLEYQAFQGYAHGASVQWCGRTYCITNAVD